MRLARENRRWGYVRIKGELAKLGVGVRHHHRQRPAPPRPGAGRTTSGLSWSEFLRDAKFTGPFDEVFRSEGTEIIRMPLRAPRANAHAERWVRTMRNECLDWILIANRRHLERVLRIYLEHHNRQRPHRGLALCPPAGSDAAGERETTLGVRRRDVLGGLIHEYERAA